MTGAVIAAVIALGMQTHTGYAVHYSPNLMEQVSHNRGMEIVPCMISSPRYELNQWLYVYGHNTGKTLLCRTTDVSHPKDKPRHLEQNLLVELDYNSNWSICGSDKIRRIDCTVSVVEKEFK